MRIQQLYRAVFGREALRDEVAAGIRFLEQTPKAGGDAETKRLDVWQYGTLATDGAFRPFRYFTGDAWQGSSMLPDRLAGSARLRANGGEPGEAPVVRRWVSPLDGRISIEGTLRHNQRTFRSGDGVRARLVSSRLGELASWVVDGRSAETRMTGVEVNKGDTIDFVVDGRDDPTGDDFVWDAAVQAVEPRPQMFKAAADFRGPAPERLSNWEQYAQVLLNTNEFAFVD